jgi:signal-transduction protein with cAMP-binding, CBS, and nucleotidyltransferase domain/PAS domain-containing protein
LRINVKRFFLTIVLPTLLTIGLFVLLIFRFIIPYFEQNMLNQKKEMIREMVSSSVSIADTFRRQALAGEMSEAAAQAAAILQIQNIRYGTGNKDYCWITDLQPRMIRHPYRPDLNGTDLSGFRDPKGKRLFVEMVQAIEKNGAGYVDYMWQWMDDPGRIVPKISYVREFKPWGWIIGTGIYIEDIRAEIAGIKKRLLLVLLLILAAMSLLLTFIVRQNLKTEMKRNAAERDLLESREKYKALVEASTEGTWMILGGATIYANKKLGEIIPGIGQQAISDDFREIIAPDRRDEIQAVGDFSRGAATFLRLETRLLAAGKQPIDVMLSISKIVLSEKRGYIVIITELGRHGEPPGSPGRELADMKERQLAREELVSDMQSVLLLLQQPVAQVMRQALACPLNATIRTAAELMSAQGVDALLVRSGAGDPIGIVTDGDMRRRVVGGGIDPQLPVTAIMSSPLKTGSETLPLAGAWNEMKQAGIKHLVITDSTGKVRGIAARGDFDCSLFQPGQLPAAEGGQPPLLSALRTQFLKLPELLDVFVRSHTRSEWLTGLTTASADLTAAAVAGIVRQELGQPPVPFAFFVLGSEGRSESTLFTDQDNALVYLDPPAPQAESCRRYFLEFGERMNRMLAQTGYSLCPGQVMAKNPRWNQPLSVWKHHFNDWIVQPGPQNLLDSTTFFDLRRVYGDAEPVMQLQDSIRISLKENPAFFSHLARLCLQYKIPLGIFGKIQTDPSEPHHNRLNIKNPLRVIVNLVRLYSMANGIDELNTLLRIRRLHEQGVISTSFFQDLDYAFDFLICLQFRSQMHALETQKSLSYSIAMEELAGTEVTTLKTIFAEINSFQSKLKHDFSISE